MLKKSEMVSRVRRHLFDVAPNVAEFSTADLEQAIAEALLAEPAALATEERGRAALAKVSEAVDLVAGTEVYSVPADCVRLLEVRVRSSSWGQWEALPYTPDSSRAACGQALWFRSGAALSLDQAGALSGLEPWRWTDADDPAAIRILPMPAGSGRSLQFKYVHAPTWDLGEDEENPDEDPVLDAREGYDALVCLRAALLLAVDESESMQMGQRLAAMRALRLSAFLGGVAGGAAMPPRRYIRRGG